MQKAAKAPAKIDGRTARAHRTRAAILDALLDLVEEGNAAPTALEIANRAKVALRSIRQHFESREVLFLAGTEQFQKRVGHLSMAPQSTEGSLENRVDRFVAARAPLLEATAALRRAAALRETTSAALALALRNPARDRRKEVERVFAPELAKMQGRRTTVLDALDLTASGKAWDILRRDMNRSRSEAERVMTAALLAIARG